MKRKEGFILYCNQWDLFSMLSMEQRGECITAIYEYAMTCQLPEIDDPLVKMAFVGIAGQMERDNTKYFEKCDKNRENAYKLWEQKKGDRKRTDATAYDRKRTDATAYDRKRTDANDADKDEDEDVDVDVDVDVDRERDYNAHAREKTKASQCDGAVTPSNREGTTAHGQYKNVYITEAERAELIGVLGEVRTNSTIERLSVYIKQRGDKYCDHSAVIRQWAAEDAANKGGTDSGFETDEYFEAALNRSKRYLNDTKAIETSTNEDVKPP